MIGWYLRTGGPGNGGPPGLVFDAFNASADDWLDWDPTNDPFTVTSGDRLAGPDDDEAVTDRRSCGRHRVGTLSAEPLTAEPGQASSTIVTGPSLTSSTSIFAPKTPVSTDTPSASSAAQKRS